MTARSPRYLLDTNILLAYIRANQTARNVEATYGLTAGTSPADLPLISIVTEAETRALAIRLHWGAAKVAYLNQFLRRLETVPINSQALVDAYVQIEVYSLNIGRPLGSKNDLWIAATASVTSATLLTTDRDFDHLHPRFLTRDWIAP